MTYIIVLEVREFDEDRLNRYFYIHLYMLGGKDPKERSNYGLKIEFFHFVS